MENIKPTSTKAVGGAPKTIVELDREHFVKILQRRAAKDGIPCVALTIRQDLIKHSVKKNRPKDLTDDNLLFPPSVLNRCLDDVVVKRTVQCKCTICKASPRGNVVNDAFLVDTLTKNDSHGKYQRILLGTLIYMGAPFAIRHTYSYNTQGSRFPSQLETFKHELFTPLTDEGLLRTAQKDMDSQETMDVFFAIFDITERLFNSPIMELRSLKTRFDGINLPFIGECQLGNVNSSFGKLYRFHVHDEYRGPNMPSVLVRKEVVFKETDEEQKTLSFLQRCKKPSLIQMLFWYRIDDKINYVFPSYPGSLLHVLQGKLLAPDNIPKPAKYGTRLNHWMWQGMVDVLAGLKFFHLPLDVPGIDLPKGLIAAHFDMKPANILVDTRGNLIITDFGQARLKKIEVDGGTGIQALLGDLNYQPPEAAVHSSFGSGQSPVSSRAYDVWSMACIMVEVIEFIINNDAGEGHKAFRKFSESRRTGNDKDFCFWKKDPERSNDPKAFVLRPSVQAALRRFRRQRDTYLDGVTDLLEWMFSPSPEKRPTIADCFGIVSEDIPTDQWPLLDDGEDSICGLMVSPQLRNMHTQFQRKEEPLRRCKLYLLLNIHQERFRSVVEFKQDDARETRTPLLSCVLSDSAALQIESFKPKTLFEAPYSSESITEWRYSFGSMHHNLTFQFDGHQTGFGDYYHFLAAATKQQNISKFTDLKISSCVYKPAKISDRKVRLGSGHAQIWQQLSNDGYKKLFIDRRTGESKQDHDLLQSSSTHRSGLGSTSTVSSHSNTAPKSSTEFGGPFRLAIFIYGPPAHLLTINLTDGFSRRHMGFTHSQRKSREHVWFQNWGANFCIGDITSPDNYPGIPMDTEALLKHEKVKVNWVEIEFANAKAVTEFGNKFAPSMH